MAAIQRCHKDELCWCMIQSGTQRGRRAGGRAGSWEHGWQGCLVFPQVCTVTRDRTTVEPPVALQSSERSPLYNTQIHIEGTRRGGRAGDAHRTLRRNAFHRGFLLVESADRLSRSVTIRNSMRAGTDASRGERRCCDDEPAVSVDGNKTYSATRTTAVPKMRYCVRRGAGEAAFVYGSNCTVRRRSCGGDDGHEHETGDRAAKCEAARC
jgi:hypothetical protein